MISTANHSGKARASDKAGGWLRLCGTIALAMLAFTFSGSPGARAEVDQYCIDNPDDFDECPPTGGGGGGDGGGDGEGPKCKLEEVTSDWMTEKVEPVSVAAKAVQDIIDGIDGAIEIDKCNLKTVPGEKTACLDDITTEKKGLAPGYTLEKFGQDNDRKTNRSGALAKFRDAQTKMKKFIKVIAGSADDTCSSCFVLQNWHILGAAVFWINDTHNNPSTKNHIGLGVEDEFQRSPKDNKYKPGGNFSPIKLGNVTEDALKTTTALRKIKRLKTLICKSRLVTHHDSKAAFKLKRLAMDMQRGLNYLIKKDKWPADFSGKTKMSKLSADLDGKCDRADFLLSVEKVRANICSDPDVVSALAKENEKP